MNRQLLTKWSNLTKVILAVLIIFTASESVKANLGYHLLHPSDSCANVKTANVDIKLLKSTSDYHILSVTTNNSSSDYNMYFTNVQSDVLYSAVLPTGQSTKRYAISRSEELDGLKLIVTNNKCNLSTTYDLSFVTKVTEQLLVSKN